MHQGADWFPLANSRQWGFVTGSWPRNRCHPDQGAGSLGRCRSTQDLVQRLLDGWKVSVLAQNASGKPRRTIMARLAEFLDPVSMRVTLQRW